MALLVSKYSSDANYIDKFFDLLSESNLFKSIRYGRVISIFAKSRTKLTCISNREFIWA